eukprot:scaffold214072_cov36-Tisochrysis_lutea.AAC.5
MLCRARTWRIWAFRANIQKQASRLPKQVWRLPSRAEALSQGRREEIESPVPRRCSCVHTRSVLNEEQEVFTNV